MPPSSMFICPYCEGYHEELAAIAMALGGPKPGDMLVCTVCGGLSVVEAGFMLRAASPEEVDRVKDSPVIQAAIERGKARKTRH